MTARVTSLLVAELTLIAGGAWVVARHPVPGTGQPEALAVLAFVVAMVALVKLPKIYIEHRRHGAWITPADGAVLVGLFTLGPVVTVLAAMFAEVVISLGARQRPLKFVFNLVSMLGGYTAAAATFAAVGRTDPLDPVAWGAGLLALAACAVWDVLSTAALFGLLEGRPFRSVLNGIAPPVLSSLALSAALGLTTAVLIGEHPVAAFLVVPVLAMLVVSTRAAMRSQAERSRLERLYLASSNLASVTTRDEVLSAIAGEARSLITGVAAVCATSRSGGPWQAVLVDDDGTSPLSRLATGQLLAVCGHADQGARELDRPLVHELPQLPNLVWASAGHDGEVQLLIAVLLELPADEQGEHRADVLATFAAHAAAVTTNVELHHDVQAALERQVALNRQKSEFVAAVSHELRTPLASLIGAIQTVRRAGDRLSRAEQVEVLELGATQGDRLRSLIEDLLLVAATEHRAVRVAQDSIDPVLVVRAAVEQLPVDAQLRVEAEVGHVGAFLSDDDKVRRILLNLLDNARKYAPDGPIEVRVDRADGQVRFTVDDHGPGVRPEDRERVFERFVQLDGSSTRQQGGTGLGLHLSRELAELLGGTLTVDQAPAGGARFRLSLPQRRGQDLVEAITTPVTAGAEAQLPVSPTPGVRRSPLRRPAEAGAALDVGAQV